MAKTAASAILELLGVEHRRVVSDWRALILLRRATLNTPSHARRWEHIPTDVADVRPILRRMVARGELKPLPDVTHLYEVTVPYASNAPLSENEMLMEAHPYATLSYLSALVFHNLTTDLPQEIVATLPKGEPVGMLPPGTTPEDWIGLSRVRGRNVKRILGQPVRWIRIEPHRYFGVSDYQPHGYPVRVTTPERTLLDGLQSPDLCGGLSNVLAAWVFARDTLDIAAIVSLTDEFETAVLRQRVGFILEALGLSDPALERWQAAAKRGGSSKLLASAPYADTYSERWSLSLNAPIDALTAGNT